MSVLEVAKSAAVLKLGKAFLLGKKFTPEVLVVVGAVAVVAAVVVTVRATLKLEGVVDKHDAVIHDLKELRGIGEITDEQYKIDLTKVQIKKLLDIGKLYAPSGLLLVGGLSCMVGATGILRKRNIAAIAAYNVVKDQYDTYRQNVIDSDGVERDRDYRLGSKTVEVTDVDTGKKKMVKTTDPSKYSRYAKIFDEGNSRFNKNWREGNLTFLLGHQKWATQRLQARGWLTLNEVYHALGFPETPDGAVVGWTLHRGDDYVDFGIFDLESPAARDFVNGYEPNIVLDFNVAGFIQDDIGGDSMRETVAWKK